MKSYFELLKQYVNDNRCSFGQTTADTVLEALFAVYSECNCMDTVEIKSAFTKLYEKMHGMPLVEMDRIIDVVCTLCYAHQRSGFIAGVKIGIRLKDELTEGGKHA